MRFNISSPGEFEQVTFFKHAAFDSLDMGVPANSFAISLTGLNEMQPRRENAKNPHLAHPH